MPNHLQGKFVWFEHYSQDPAAAQRFYSAWLGWGANTVPMPQGPYTMIVNGDETIGGYFRNEDVSWPTHWLPYVSVRDIDTSQAAALAAGASVCFPPFDAGGMGRGVGLLDPQGAAFAMWQGAEGDMPDVKMAPVGKWCWNELWTRDVPGALKFYQTVLGYSVQSMDMGAGGTYHMLAAHGEDRGGVAASVNPKARSMWLPYIHVADCDAAAAKAVKLGARLMLGPQDVPGTGRFAILVDPMGAAVGVFKPAARA